MGTAAVLRRRGRRAIALAGILVVVAAAVCVRLGFWQLQRYNERTAFNERVAEAATGSPAHFDEVGDPDEWAYRPVTATGRYDTDHEVVLLGRSLDGASGFDVVTLFVTDEGRAVWVDRGWVPGPWTPDTGHGDPPPAGSVDITGLVVASEPGGTPPSAHRTVPRLDVDALDAPGDVAAFAIQLTTGPRTANSFPRPHPPPRTDASQNLSYAIQWWLFAVVGVTVFAIAARRRTTRVADHPRRPATN